MTINESMTGFDIIFQFISESLNLSEVGLWMQNNMSVEGLVALPALLATLLIALAIYNFEDSKKGLLIDAATIMKHVVRVPLIILSFFAVSFLVIFYEVESLHTWIIPLLTAVYITGIVIIVYSLNNAYKWARSVETRDRRSIRTVVRLRYLYSLSESELLPVWNNIWREREQNKELIYQHELIEPFFNGVKRVKNRKYSSMYMIDNFISAMEFVDLTNPATMEGVVKFYIEEFRRGSRKDAVSNGIGYIVYTNAIDRLFSAIIKKTLTKDDHSLGLFIHQLKECLADSDVEESILVTNLLNGMLSLIKNREDIDWILDAIPDEWKITVENLNDNTRKKSSLATLNAYSKMLDSGSLYVDDGKKLNMPLQKITSELLPNADPMLWAKLFAFHWAPFGINDGESREEAQVRSYIENNPSFGFMSHVHTAFRDQENGDFIYEDVAKEESEVIELASITTIFGQFHNDETMGKYLRAISDLKSKYTDDESETNKLSYLEDNLKKIRKRVQERRSKK